LGATVEAFAVNAKQTEAMETAMARYYLHCTDGVDFVLDRVGHEIDAETDLMWFAYRAADRLMGELPEYDEWANWLVVVQNESGSQVEVVPFPAEVETGLAEPQSLRIMRSCAPNPPSCSLPPPSTLLH
jgi:hypothetical protein